MAALSLSAFIPSAKDPFDKRLEIALSREFQAPSNAFRASAANSIMARGAFVWGEQLAASEPKLSSRIKSTLKKIALAATFWQTLPLMPYSATQGPWQPTWLRAVTSGYEVGKWMPGPNPDWWEYHSGVPSCSGKP